MNKKNIFKLIAIILVVVGILCIALSFVVGKDKGNNKESNTNDDSDVVVQPVTPDDEIAPMTYDDVYNMAVSLYGGDNVNIEIEEDTDRFVIKRIYKTTGIIEHYYVDKETGAISTDPIFGEG